MSRLLKITGLFCRISSLLWGSFAKETYNFKEPTNRSHPIAFSLRGNVCGRERENGGEKERKRERVKKGGVETHRHFSVSLLF